MTKDKKLQIVWDPNCFDDWDSSQEELDELVAEVKRMADTGELFEHSTPVTQASWDLLPEEDKARILAAMQESDEPPRRLH